MIATPPVPVIVYHVVDGVAHGYSHDVCQAGLPAAQVINGRALRITIWFSHNAPIWPAGDIAGNHMVT
jgi:hypothetical protein